LLIALDTTTGRELWRTNVGSVLGPMANQWKPPAAADWRNLLVDTSSLAVADDLVIATPGVGCAIAVNRFTGKLRWLMKYGHMESLTARQNRYDNRAMLAGGVVAISPMDAPRVFGLDSDSGTVLWEGQAGEAVLCGGGDDSIVLATARGMMALDSRTGAKKWLIKPATGAITGPSIVVGKVALVPVSGQLSALSLVDGQVVLSPPRVPLLPALLAPEANRQMLQVDGVLANFGPPPLATAKPPK